MTEDEAKTKWCPMSRVAGGADWTGSSNRDHQSWPLDSKGIPTEFPGNGYACIASECMMWLWDEEKIYDADTPIGTELSDTNGHCGLAR